MTTVTRRSALRTTGLAALAASLLGTAPTTAAASTPQTLATVIDTGALAAHTDELLVRYHETVAAHLAATNAVADLLPRDQQHLLTDLDDAIAERHGAWGEVVVAEMARHAPGLAPLLWMLWQHVMETRTADVGRCCTRSF